MHSNEVMRQKRNEKRNSMNGVQRSWHKVNEIYCILSTYLLFTYILIKNIIVNFGTYILMKDIIVNFGVQKKPRRCRRSARVLLQFSRILKPNTVYRLCFFYAGFKGLYLKIIPILPNLFLYGLKFLQNHNDLFFILCFLTLTSPSS